MAFGVGELGLRLEELFDMPWCEFCLKTFAFRRMQEEKLRHTRIIAWNAQIGSHLDPKKLPKTIDQFMPIGVDGKKSGKTKSKVSDEMRQLYKQRMEEYNKAMELHNKNLTV